MLRILLKDLRRRSRDSTLLVFALVLPLGLTFVFGLTMGGGTPSARYGVAGPSAAEFAQRSGLSGLKPVAGAAEARRLTEGNELDAVFVVSPARVEVVGSVDAPLAVQVAREVAESYALPGGGGIPVVTDATLGTRELDARTYHAAGAAMFFIFFAVLFCVTGIFEERASGTLPRLLTMPVPRWSILAAKLLGGVLVGLVGMVVLVTVSTVLLGARWGPPAGVGALVVAAVLAATGLMTAVASFARTAEQAANWQSGVASLLGLLGGSFFPVAPELSVFTPHHWFLEGLAELRGGASILPALAVLLAVAALTLPVAAARTGRMVTP
ncbi:ABC transporter permease subunit [Nonomuraea typhae]|uniref:ABC transporter permease subunit n=1 Tax=Nonomuraea typhae TaxID=2603600 RepID=A0ABW7YS54_9ACTN